MGDKESPVNEMKPLRNTLGKYLRYRYIGYTSKT